MIDPDLVKKKSEEYVSQKFSKLLQQGTLILYEPKLTEEEMKEVLLLNGIKCDEIKKYGFVYYSPTPCYIADTRKYTLRYGTKVKGVFVQHALTSSGIDVTPYIEGEENVVLTLLTNLITQYAVFYNRSIFEAFMRAFVFDENAIVLAGPNDPPKFRFTIHELGGKDSVRQMYILVDDILIMKIPKEDLPTPYDTLFIMGVDGTVFGVATTRENIFDLAINNYEAMRSKLFEILSANKDLMEAVEHVFEQVSKEEGQEVDST